MSQRQMQRIIAGRGINMTVPFYIMGAYAYHVQDDPIMDDDAFDWLARQLKIKWSAIKHRHKWLINRDNIKSGNDTDWPNITPFALESFRHG